MVTSGFEKITWWKQSPKPASDIMVAMSIIYTVYDVNTLAALVIF